MDVIRSMNAWVNSTLETDPVDKALANSETVFFNHCKKSEQRFVSIGFFLLSMLN